MNIIENNYTLKKVAQKDSRSCSICFRQADAVLVSKDNKDWFYVCEVHLKDKGFAEEVHENGWQETLESLEKAKLGIREKKGWKEGWKTEIKIDEEKVEHLEEQLKSYKVWYVLDSLIYKTRLTKLLKKKEEAAIREKLHSGKLLPTTSNLKKL
ncbi:hypothetical protein CANINC_000239 [Pichia inconspicua]|uniref:Uncharacterized protein n=1 Tax=Pichia inconspicua TaxID=52247 RepID=A0A4T0X6Q7_9ASCO|nr:hypothetical protein CANINC_000239 [[Candida] inconspicua]